MTKFTLYFRLVPRRLSLDEDVRAKEGGKQTAVCTLSMVPCGSSAVAHLYLAKNEAPEEEAAFTCRLLIIISTHKLVVSRNFYP